jgi:L-lactate dehydrogenase complex protein LldF
MATEHKNFIARADVKAFDRDHRGKINFNISQYNATVVKGMTQYSDLESARKKVKNIKWRAIENLDTMLIEFEAQFQKRGGQVLWADNTEIALEQIIKIAKEANAKTVVKSKSMATEEIELNPALEKEGIEVFETDLGEYIQQLDGEPPYHIVTPAMHKSKEDVAKVFHEHLGTPIESTPKELTMVARKVLREKYVQADIGISGANFIIADTGSISITENEGNARLTTSFPKIHIAIVGIEKIIPSINDLSTFWPLLSTHGTGQKVTVYNTILSGPKQEGETDGPEQMYVVLLNNGRDQLLAQPDQREALYCIRCGACLNACPVYKNVGGHAYGTTYSGPIGSVITPHLKGMEEFGHLSQASSLCGNCTEVCPVRIDLHKLLVYNRRDSVNKRLASAGEKWGIYLWKKGMLSRKLMNTGSPALKNFGLKLLFGKSWGKHRTNLKLAKKSFNKQWQQQRKG